MQITERIKTTIDSFEASSIEPVVFLGYKAYYEWQRETESIPYKVQRDNFLEADEVLIVYHKELHA